MLAPQTLSIITDIFPRERRGAAFGVRGAVVGVATVAGPTVGGLLVTRLSWRWIFFVNVPVGVVAFVLGVLLVPDLRPGRRHRFDVLGVVLASIGLAAICFGLIEGERYQWGQVWRFVGIPEVLAVGTVLMAAFAVWQRVQKREPLVPGAVFRDRNFSLMAYVAAALSFGMLGMFFPLTIYLQSVLGLTALAAGLTMAPMPLTSMLLAPFTGRLADRVGGKYIVFTGLSLFAIGMGVVIATTEPTSSRWTFLPGLIIAGAGMGCTFAPLQTVAFRNVPPRLAGAASGVQNTIRQLGGVIGSAAVGALLQNRLVASLHGQAVAHAGELPAAFRGRFVQGFDDAAANGLQVGAGQSGVSLPAGIPPDAARQIGRVAHQVFTTGYVDAMHPTMILPIAVLGSGALACLAIKRRRRPGSAAARPDEQESVATG